DRQKIANQDNLFVLFRRRSDVLLASSFLADTPHRIRMSGMPVCLAPWIGATLAEHLGPDLDEAEFHKLWDDRTAESPVAHGNGEKAWKQLVRLAGRTSKSVDMRLLRQRLGRRQPPVELCSKELGDRGPVIGTIHASKGREADVVHLMLPTDPDE